jgi:UDP-N-acetylglucosamine acyltransferase
MPNEHNEIHPTAIIGPGVTMGKNNKILPYTIIWGPTTIGDNNIIGPHAVIGSTGQDSRNPRYDSSASPIEIGNNNIIREFTAVQKPAYRDITRIGNDVFLMQGVHIPHDAILHDNVIIAPNTVLGGIVTLMKAANIGIGVSFHQFSVIGQYSMVAMGATIVKNVRPFSSQIPGKAPKVNMYAVRKFGFEEYTPEIEAYVLNGTKPVSDAISSIVEEFERCHVDSKRKLYE